ncbi:cytochrome c oxidase subunit 3 [Hypericibacter sp.]|uniref:cytochrome c oxidase subunit 3 n=1 Tax=Hypericibacter sp. TaxID=2705401 RepID=UPI003D6CA787
MNLFRQMTEKPWAPIQGNVVDLHDGSAFSVPTATLGLRVFLAVVTVLFLLLIMAYGSRMEYEDWRPTPQLWLLWLNTAMLALSSVAMQWARMAARRGEINGVTAGLIAGGVFAVAFLGGQILAWRQLNMMIAFDITNPAIAFFYLITALHGLHLLGGLVAWGRTTAKLWRGFDVVRLRLSVELCAVYWHFLLVVWLILFGLLFSGNDTLGTLLAICGIR